MWSSWNCWWRCKMMKQLWKTVEELLIKVNSHSSSDPETFLLNSYLREMKNMSTKRCAQRFTKRLISKKQNLEVTLPCIHQEKGWTLLCSHTGRHDSSRKGHDSASRNNCIDFKNKVLFFFLQETQKGTYCRISLVQNLKRDKTYLWSRNQNSGHL